MVAEARDLAEELVSKAREESERLRAEAKKELAQIEVRQQEIKAEMARVHGVLDALAGPVGVSVPVGPPAKE
jgi:cell division septum initiation protein DivIVA